MVLTTESQIYRIPANKAKIADMVFSKCCLKFKFLPNATSRFNTKAAG